MNNSIIVKNKSGVVQTTLTDSNIYGGVEFEVNGNPDEDISVGTTAAAKITFTTDSLNNGSIGYELTLMQKQMDDTVYVKKGVFIITELSKTREGVYKVTAYDNISRFDTDIKSWIDNLDYDTGISVGDLFKGMCTQVGATYPPDYTFINDTIIINQPIFGGDTINARTVLGYIAAVAGGFACANNDGQIIFKHFGDNSTVKNLTRAMFKKVVFADYNAARIETVKVSVGDSDVGVVVGTGEGVLQIPYNAIFYNDSKETTQGYITNIKNKVSTYLYRPAKIELFSDYGIEVGDAVRVQTSDTDSFISYVFSKKITNSGVTLESTGSADRDVLINSGMDEVQQLVGKYNKIQSDVNGIRVITGDLSQKVEHTMVWDATGATIRDQDGNEVKIDGKSITAGTINAGDINMTGAITWGDLASDTQQKIESAGQVYRQDTVPSNPQSGAFWYVTGVTDIIVGDKTYYAGSWYNYNGTAWEFSVNPKAITHTSIDKYKIISPEIEGNNIILHSNSGGSFQVHTEKAGVDTTLGFMGTGSAYINERIEQGICLANDSDGDSNTVLGADDNYIIITPSEMRLCFSWSEGDVIYNQNIKINKDGAFYVDKDEVAVPLGAARFL